MEGLVDSVGMGQLYRMRKAVPRETYQHYQIFKAPEADYVSPNTPNRDTPWTRPWCA